MVHHPEAQKTYVTTRRWIWAVSLVVSASHLCVFSNLGAVLACLIQILITSCCLRDAERHREKESQEYHKLDRMFNCGPYGTKRK